MKPTYAMTSKELQTAHQNATTVSDWYELGYTKAYAKAMVAKQQRADVRIDVLATIDELNQYLLGNITIEAATDAVRELTHKLNEQW